MAVYGQEGSGEKSAAERAFERLDVRAELDRLDRMLEDLKIQYEQYFTGVLPLAPDRVHNEVKRQRRKLLGAPFKNSEMNYRFQSLESRYHSYRSYWERVLREREAGTYSRDVFKANLRERMALEDQHAQTEKGRAEHHLVALFNSYKEALEKQSGREIDLEFAAFRKQVVQRAREFKETNGASKISFKVVTKDGRVSLQAHKKE